MALVNKSSRDSGCRGLLESNLVVNPGIVFNSAYEVLLFTIINSEREKPHF
jgi:hypothetical protein